MPFVPLSTRNVECPALFTKSKFAPGQLCGQILQRIKNRCPWPRRRSSERIRHVVFSQTEHQTNSEKKMLSYWTNRQRNPHVFAATLFHRPAPQPTDRCVSGWHSVWRCDTSSMGDQADIVIFLEDHFNVHDCSRVFQSSRSSEEKR